MACILKRHADVFLTMLIQDLFEDVVTKLSNLVSKVHLKFIN